MADERIDRRGFLASASAALAMVALPLGGERSSAAARARIRAVAFDGYAVFDATTLIAAAESVVPGRGRELVGAWRTRQFEYQWLRTLGEHYADFNQTGADALTFAAQSLGISFGDEQRAKLLSAQQTLAPWPDAAAAIARLRGAGLRLAFLSNMTEHMLDDGARRAGFRDGFEHVLSTDRIRAAKPDPRAYQMALDAFGMPREEVAFVGFAGWDAAGSTWFGYPTVWTNRLATPAEQLDATPALTCRNLADAVEFLLKSAT